MRRKAPHLSSGFCFCPNIMVEGNSVEGWLLESLKQTITQSLQHLSIAQIEESEEVLHL